MTEIIQHEEEHRIMSNLKQKKIPIKDKTISKCTSETLMMATYFYSSEGILAPSTDR